MTAGKNPAGIYYLLAGGARRLRERTSWKNPADSYDRQHPRKKRPAEPERNGREKTCRHPPAGEARKNSGRRRQNGEARKNLPATAGRQRPEKQRAAAPERRGPGKQLSRRLQSDDGRHPTGRFLSKETAPALITRFWAKNGAAGAMKQGRFPQKLPFREINEQEKRCSFRTPFFNLRTPI